MASWEAWSLAELGSQGGVARLSWGPHEKYTLDFL